MGPRSSRTLGVLLLTALLAAPASLPVGASSTEPPEVVEEPYGQAKRILPDIDTTVAAGTAPPHEAGNTVTGVAGGTLSFVHYPAPSSFSFAARAGETSIGANLESGNVLFLMTLNTARVTWDKNEVPPRAVWQDISFPTTSQTTLDPLLWTDQQTGRTFVLQLAGAQSAGVFTDDDGDTWVPMGNPGAPPSIDHQKLGGGPYHAPLPAHNPSPAYANNLYYCLQQGVSSGGNGFAQCSRSDDGGLTFGAPFYMDLLDCFPIHDQPVVGPDGSVYVAVRACGSGTPRPQGVLLSRDNGLTWDVSTIPGTAASVFPTPSGTEFGTNTDVAFDAGGRLYWIGGSATFTGVPGPNTQTGKLPLVAVSTDGGVTWSPPVNLGAAFGVRNTEMTAVVGGDAGRAAASFYGTTTPGNDQLSGFNGRWHLYVSYTFDGGATWTTIDTTPDDPVQVGCIWNRGGSNACRNLLDFQDMTVDSEGRVLVGYADGCIADCVATPSPSLSRASYGKIARQTTGLRLFAEFDPPGGIDPLGLVTAALPYKTKVGVPVTVSAQALGGVGPYTIAWDFDGDGATDATGGSVSFPASSFGVHTLSATVTDAADSTASADAVVLVKDLVPEVVLQAWSFDSADCSDGQGWVSAANAVTSVPPSAAGVPWHLTTDRPASAPCAWYHGVDATKSYLDTQAVSLLGPCLRVPPEAQGLRLGFGLAGSSEVGFDFFDVLGGKGCVEPTAGVCVNCPPVLFRSYHGTVGSLLADPPVYAAQSVGMDTLLPQGGDTPFQLRFRFISDSSVTGTGFELDDVRVFVSDGPPVVGSLDLAVFRAQDVDAVVPVHDPDMDPLTVSAMGLPPGAQFDPATGRLTWDLDNSVAAGTYTIVVKATDGLFTSEGTIRITVLNIPPVAAGSADKTVVDRVRPVKFRDLSTDADGTIVAWLWDFGDGKTSPEQNPAHLYKALGFFDVTLTVTDNDGDSDTAAIATIEVKNIPPKGKANRQNSDWSMPEGPGIETDAWEANRVDPVQFRDESTDEDGRLVAWAWDFGDGGNSAQRDPSHQYRRLGTFPVALRATDNDGDSSWDHATVTVVNLLPLVAFAHAPSIPYVFEPVRFRDGSLDRDGAVVDWRWDFGDGTTSTEPSPTHVYTKGGRQIVRLTATDNDGDVATTAQDVWVCNPAGEVASSVQPDRIHVGATGCVDVSQDHLPV